MTMLPTNRRIQPQMGGLQSALGQFADQIDQQKDRDFYNKVFAANPQLAGQYFGGLQNQRLMELREEQQKRELAKQDALRRFAERIGSPTGINPDGQSSLEGALGEYATISGDPSVLLNYRMKQEALNSPASMGATGALAQQLIDEPNNGIDTFYDALVAIKGGAGATGRLGSEIELGRQAEFEKQTGQNISDLEYKPQIGAETVRAETSARFNQQGQQDLIAQQRAVEDAESNNMAMSNKASLINDRINNLTAGWTGNLSKAVRGTEAFNLYADIQTLVANSALDTLIDLKSKGGTLGALSEKELELLMAKKANLDQSQSPEQLRRNLAEFVAQNNSAIANLKKRYEQDFERFGGEQVKALPAPQSTKTLKWGDLP